VCRFHIATSWRRANKIPLTVPLLECHYASKHHLLEYWLFPTGRLNLGFITEGKLAAIFIKPSHGVSNWPVIYFINYTPTSFLAPFITAPSKGDVRGWTRAHTIDRRGLGVACATAWCGRPLPPPPSLLWTPSCVGKNRNFGFCFVQFWEYFLCNFSETQKWQKTGNWHCGILLIG
jgi:hypothetical protein